MCLASNDNICGAALIELDLIEWFLIPPRVIEVYIFIRLRVVCMLRKNSDKLLSWSGINTYLLNSLNQDDVNPSFKRTDCNSEAKCCVLLFRY